MFDLFLSFILIYGIKSNVAINGAGVLIFQKEKQYTKFRLLNAMFLSLGVIFCLVISFFLDKYVYSTYNLEYLSVIISVLIVGIYNLIVSKAFSKMSHYTYYLYEKSCSFAIDFVFTLSIILSIDFKVFAMMEFLVMSFAIGLVLFICNLILGVYIEDSYKSSIDKQYLNLPARLFMLSIFSIILYYASMLIK